MTGIWREIGNAHPREMIFVRSPKHQTKETYDQNTTQTAVPSYQTQHAPWDARRLLGGNREETALDSTSGKVFRSESPMKLLLSVFCVLVVLGCATTNTDTAGRLLASTAQTVDAAMKGWAQWVQMSGKATKADQDNVRSLYSNYQTAMSIAQASYIAFATTGDKNVWLRASAALTASKADLLRFLDLIQNRT
jgi:hypothetical protein